MKALFRNLVFCAAVLCFAGQAKAAGADVVWTFSGFQFDTLFDYGTQDVVGTATGTIQAGSTMTFSSTGQLLAFNIVTTSGAFGFTYSSVGGATVAAPAAYAAVAGVDVSSNFPGAWEFATGESLLAITFSGGGTIDPSTFAEGWSPIMPIGIDQNNTLELAFTPEITETYPDGLARLGLDDGSGVITATRVPEPASMALLGTGLLGLGFAARRRNRVDA